MNFGYIYKIVFPNGKNYIGLTTTSLDQSCPILNLQGCKYK